MGLLVSTVRRHPLMASSLRVTLDPNLHRQRQGVRCLWQRTGIGKSTTSSDTSAAFSLRERVLQIGCDPKHDSTFTLTKLSTTVIDVLETVGSTTNSAPEYMFEGCNGVMWRRGGRTAGGHRLCGMSSGQTVKL
jgi:light-independent protochlorophyllide reductase subunit L